jgi:bis(5'-nucleosyl)-tetraphosphatase (symmetrical)
MKTYAIGDVHGCFDTLEQLLQQIPNKSRLVFIGDIINRGPKSLETIRTVMRMGDRAECLLGNHELHLLAVYAGQRAMSPEDTISEILNAPDCEDIIQWLRNRPLALVDHGFLCVHAATHWSWSVEETLKQASRVEKFIRSDKGLSQIGELFGKQQWSPDLRGKDRLRAVVNVLTRTRYLNADGTMDFKQKLSPADTPVEYIPWFKFPGFAAVCLCSLNSERRAAAGNFHVEKIFQLGQIRIQRSDQTGQITVVDLKIQA